MASEKLMSVLGDWYPGLVPEFSKEYLRNIGKLLTHRSGELEPKGGLDVIFRAYKESQLFETKVVILGQDPYPGGQANGLAFSSLTMTASLRVIFESLDKTYGVRREDPDLTDWAKQGVLLLNTSLTCYKGKSDSCRNWGWNEFIVASLRLLPKTVPILTWGKQATEIAVSTAKVPNPIFTTYHPAALAHNPSLVFDPCWNTVNDYVRIKNKQPIKWV